MPSLVLLSPLYTHPIYIETPSTQHSAPSQHIDPIYPTQRARVEGTSYKKHYKTLKVRSVLNYCALVVTPGTWGNSNGLLLVAYVEEKGWQGTFWACGDSQTNKVMHAACPLFLCHT